MSQAIQATTPATRLGYREYRDEVVTRGKRWVEVRRIENGVRLRGYRSVMGAIADDGTLTGEEFDERPSRLAKCRTGRVLSPARTTGGAIGWFPVVGECERSGCPIVQTS